MPNDMEYSRFSKEGKFRSSSGTDELGADEKIDLSVDPSKYASDGYEEGDEIDLNIKGRIGGMDENGKAKIEVLTCEIAPMPGAAKKYRNERKNEMPPASTMGEDE